ncbi:MAG: glycosyltransferase family 2 protein [Clostridium sp.]|nr:glycosyltransferase family 2 protein [Clostridium sp.]MBQ5421319.1 glycosyltransferase family 2 protein [Clostridium sp.]HAE81345.1 glycosyl transferase family 2 [Lachnoclostridium sp.]
MTDVLVIIPAYNESANIETVVGRLNSICPNYDYVVVNDGSTDSTAEICRRCGFNLLDLPVNLGLAGGFQAGLRYAARYGYRYAIQIDGDGQHRPEYIRSMKEKMDEGYDIVIGSRFVGEKKPFTMRMIGSRMIGFAIRLTTGKKIQDPTSGMRMFSRRMIEMFAEGLNFGPEPDTVSYLIRKGAKVAEVPVKMDERMGGVSYLTPLKSASYMIKMLVSILVIQGFR